MKKIHIPFIIALVITIIFFGILVFPDIFRMNEFETITEISDLYDETIYVIFKWTTEDELQVGKPISVSSTVIGLPYTKAPSNPIEIHYLDTNPRDLEKHELKSGFDVIIPYLERQIFGREQMKSEELISEINYVSLQFTSLKNVTLNSGKETTSIDSDETIIRYIVPKSVSIEFCDYNTKPDCIEIENIIQPAPHHTFEIIQTNRMVLAASLIIILITIIVAWVEINRKYRG